MISGQEVMAGGGGAQEKIWVEVSGRAVTQAGQGHGLSCSGEARSAVRFGQDEGGEGDERRGGSGAWAGPRSHGRLSGVWLFIRRARGIGGKLYFFLGLHDSMAGVNPLDGSKLFLFYIA